MKNKLMNEINKYKTFYYRTSYCYEKIKKDLKKIRNEDYDSFYNQEVFFTNDDLKNEIKITSSYQMMYGNLIRTDIILLQQLILTRLISALEVSMIQNIMDVFMVNKKPFLSQSKFEITESELLVTKNIEELQLKIINNTCRNVQSQGIKGIASFYKKVFKINIESFNMRIGDSIYNFEDILKLHDMRHMVIHNLGKLDSNFRKQYKCKETTVKFTSKEFLVIFDVLACFADFINNQMGKLLQPEIEEINENEDVEYKINLTIKDSKVLYIFKDSYSFKYKDQIYNFHSIRKSIKKNAEIIDLRIIGDGRIARKYLSILRKCEKTNLLTINQLEAFRDFHESNKKNGQIIRLFLCKLV